MRSISYPLAGRRAAVTVAVAVALVAAGLALPAPASAAVGTATVSIGTPVGEGVVDGVVTSADPVTVPITLTGFDEADSLVAVVRVPVGGGSLTVDAAAYPAIVDEYGYSHTAVQSVAFHGTRAAVATALAQHVHWVAPMEQAVELSVSVSEYEPGLYFNAANGHYYKPVTESAAISWTEARNAAAAATQFGMSGYLATLSTKQENLFSANNIDAANLWIGASDAVEEGLWRWVTGPESGEHFWSGAANGSIPNGRFASWAMGEPNNASNEDYAGTNFDGARGRWNDFQVTNSSVRSYLIEFGGMSGETSTAISATATGSLEASAPILVGTSVDGRFVPGAVSAPADADGVPFAIELQRFGSTTGVFAATVGLPSGGGALRLLDDTGLTRETGHADFSGGQAVQTLGFSGSYAAVSAALRGSIVWDAPAGASSIDLSVSVAEKAANAFYNPDNGHYYRVYSPGGALSFGAALNPSPRFTLFGMTGYLATVTNAAENAFTATYTTASNAWIAASDERGLVNGVADIQYVDQNSVEGRWHWVAGPEAGTPFWTGGSSGSVAAGGFASWAGGEPNNTNGEHYAATNYQGVVGRWNDFQANTSGTTSALIEFGGMPNEVSTARAAIGEGTLVSQVPPSAPRELSVVPGIDEAAVTWTAPASDGNAAITGYAVTASPGGATCTATATACTVTGLQPATKYVFSVAATNQVGSGPAAQSGPVTTLIPGAPTDVAGVHIGDAVTATWSAPANGASVIDSYTAQLAPGGQRCTVEAPATTCDITGVDITDGPFTLTVTADYGTGTRESVGVLVTPSVPSAPRDVAVAAGPGTATVSWQTPVVAGDAASYVVVASPGGAVCTAEAPATSCTIAGLTTAAPHHGEFVFSVTAVGPLGSSAAAESAETSVAAVVPDAPGKVVFTQNGPVATLTWTAPANDGGAPVTAYSVRDAVTGRACTVAAPATTCEIVAIDPGVSYDFRVTATNGVGTGGASPSSPVTSATAPSAPTGVSITPGAVSVVISWTAPTDDGGSSVTGYRATLSPGGAQCETAETTCTIAGLDPLTAYAVTVRAVNAIGAGAAAMGTTTTVDDPPSAPRDVVGDHRGDDVVVTWQAPASLGAYTIVGYRAELFPGGLRCDASGSQSTCTITDVPIDEGPYEVTVSAEYRNGATSASAVVTPSLPSAPRDVTVTADAGSATVSWLAPTISGGTTHYVVTATPGGASCEVAAPATSCTIPGLAVQAPHHGEYTFSVVAIGPLGESRAEPSPVIPVAATAPAAPSGITVTQRGDTATISWTAPADGGAPITGYTVRDAASGLSCTATAPATSCDIPGLEPDRAYEFVVEAVNGVGAGPAAEPQHALAGVVPQPATTPSVTVGTGSPLPIAFNTGAFSPGGWSSVSLTLPANAGTLAVVDADGDDFLDLFPTVAVLGNGTGALSLSGPTADLAAALAQAVTIAGGPTPGSFEMAIDVAEAAPGTGRATVGYPVTVLGIVPPPVTPADPAGPPAPA
ncbi:MAG TPA: fibronectin type III domain-containing protein, partial [Rhodoglobus sp.]|nr:fibronectin type III domain-containing protein [Rhodoglobus sp.]